MLPAVQGYPGLHARCRATDRFECKGLGYRHSPIGAPSCQILWHTPSCLYLDSRKSLSGRPNWSGYVGLACHDATLIIYFPVDDVAFLPSQTFHEIFWKLYEQLAVGIFLYLDYHAAVSISHLRVPCPVWLVNDPSWVHH